MSAVHAGGGTADDPSKAAIVRVIHLPSSEGPKAHAICTVASGIQEPLPMRRRPAQGRGVYLPSPGLLQKAVDMASTAKSRPSSLLWSTFHPDALLSMTASRNDVGQGSPTFKNDVFMYFLGISIRALGTRVLRKLSRPSRAGCNHITLLLQNLPSAVTHKIDTGTRPWHLTPASFLIQMGPSFDGHCPCSSFFILPLC